ncbi:MAG: glycoside hydrolase family 127 protein [Thermoguttaceae bacterium]|nr:glycoside hydrolase family 127 protein [Thermoguttaceae bacterium]
MKRTLSLLLFAAAAIIVGASLFAEEPPKLQRPLTEVPFTEVHLTDGFWAPRIETNRTVSARHNIDWCENQTGRINNFRKAGGSMEGKFEGIYFDDSDVYKVIEGLAYALAAQDDKEIHDDASRWIEAIASAQQDDGYLMCWFILEKPDEKWTNLASMHELYCAGHMAEAAVAWKRATGDDSLLNVSRRQMDLICSRYGAGEGQLKNVAGHEEIELALVKLYELTGEKKYLDEAKFFIDCRGVADGREKGLFGEYCQDHIPLRQQSEIVGHAVRAMYCFSGATDVAGYYHDTELMAAMNRLWNNVTREKMYITGGIGSDASNEGFRGSFFLPNDTAYCETCAAIGLVLWAHRMNLSTGQAKFVDVMERALYNGMLSGYSISGDRYFYVNKLRANGDHHRQPFFGCACCPTNVIRLIASLPGYVYATAKSDGAEGDDTVVANLFVEGDAAVDLADARVKISQKTGYPFDGKVVFTLSAEPKDGASLDGKTLYLKYRVPGWCADAAEAGADGYAVVPFSASEGLTYECDFPMPVVRMTANPQVEADRCRVALQRGPIVYCFEECDNTVAVDDITLPKDPNFEVQFKERFISTPDDSEATRDSGARDVAVITARDDAGNAITAIPYCVWDNRAAGKMNVWVRQDGLRPLLAPRDRVVRYFTEEIPESAGEEDITRAVPRLLARTRAYLAKENGWYEGDLPILYRPLSDKDFQ